MTGSVRPRKRSRLSLEMMKVKSRKDCWSDFQCFQIREWQEDLKLWRPKPMLLSEIYGELETGNSIGQVKQMIHSSLKSWFNDFSV